MIAWFFSYVVFTNALLRSIERHPAPYRTFTLLALEGATLSSMGALLADLIQFIVREVKGLRQKSILSSEVSLLYRRPS